VNVKTRQKTKLKLPNHHAITAWSRDGKLFLTTAMKAENARIYLMNRDGAEHKPVTGAKQSAALGRLAPDGKRVLCVTEEVAEETPAEKKARQEAGGRPPQPVSKLAVVDVATGKSSAVQDIPLEADVLGYCWSPDGKRIAYTWRKIRSKPGELKDDEWFLIVSDPDGKNQKTIATEKGQAKWVMMSNVDWR
jgi:Tol biopolymer transport system component